MSATKTNRLRERGGSLRRLERRGQGEGRPASEGARHGWQVPITHRWLVGQSQLVVQTLVAWAAMLAAYWFWRGDRLYANARVFGGILAGMGATALYQAGVASLLPIV